MVFPSRAVVCLDETVGKGSISVKSKVIRSNLVKKGVKRLSRRRRKAKRKRERYFKERKQMASLGKGPYDYYWGNYFRCVKWVQNHHASYWKSRAQALEYENKMLRTLIDQSSATQLNFADVSGHSQDCQNNVHYAVNIENPSDCEVQGGAEGFHQNHDCDYTGEVHRSARTRKRGKPRDGKSDTDNEEFEFEINDTMIEFFTQSMKHKLALQHERDKDSGKRDADHNDANVSTVRTYKKKSDNMGARNLDDVESSYDACMMGLKKVLPTQCFEQNKTVEAKDFEDILLMKAQREDKEKQKHELFGKSASKILGMETAVQLNFKQTCASKRPVVWPIIPLNL